GATGEVHRQRARTRRRPRRAAGLHVGLNPAPSTGAMEETGAVDDPKAMLHRYLRTARDAVVWKLDGLGEGDIRRPMVPTGNNLLRLAQHLASVEAGYFGEVFGRPFPEPMPWMDEDAEPNADM